MIAGPNGAGKTTFAREFLLKEAHIPCFVNADLIAAGLSPLDPAAARLAAGRLFLRELDRHASQGDDFAFETTLAGLAYAKRLQSWKSSGYHIEIVFLWLRSPRLAKRRVATRVRQGGHTVPSHEIERRFVRGWKNFLDVYRPLADAWSVYDNSAKQIRLIEAGP